MSQKISKNLKESHEKGNTKSSRSRKFFCTINNYSDEEYNLALVESQNTQLFIVAKEVGSKNGVEHLHFWFQYKNQKSWDTLKKLFPRANIEHSHAKPEHQSYLLKDGNYVTNIKFENNFEVNQQKLKNWYLENDYKDIVWKPWQEFILSAHDKPVDRRKIYWFWSKKGNLGKSFITDYLSLKYDAIIAEGKRTDVFNQVLKAFVEGKDTNVVVCDIERSSSLDVDYSILEKLKGRIIYSGKYEGGRLIIPPMHIFVVANFPPNQKKLSQDRWHIERVDEELSDDEDSDSD